MIDGPNQARAHQSSGVVAEVREGIEPVSTEIGELQLERHQTALLLGLRISRQR